MVEVRRSLLVVRQRFRCEVRVAIHLDGELRARRIEVDDVGIDAVLAPKLRAELLPSEM